MNTAILSFRSAAVWTPGHATSGPADKTFNYDVSDTGPTIVTTNTINTAGTSLPSETFYDSLGRQIETQTQTPDGGRDITDTYYNSDGWQLVTSSPYYATGAPSATLVPAPDDQVPSQTGYFYDGDGRVIRQVLYSLAVEKWETDTAYGGDYTTATRRPAAPRPPATPTGSARPATSTSTIRPPRQRARPHPGRVHLRWPRAGTRPATPTPPAGQLATITDDAGNHWAYGYDLAGDQTTATDPDAGTTTSTYDPDKNRLSTTDASGKTISYTYDADGRKSAEYDTTGSAPQAGADELAAWAYDTLAKGQPASSTGGGGGNGGGGGSSSAPTHYCPLQICGRMPNVKVKRTPRQVIPRQHSTGTNTCTVADSRFGLDPTCTPDMPKGGGGLPSWLVHAAKWTWDHQGQIVDGIALGQCLTPGVDLGAPSRRVRHMLTARQRAS